MKTFWAILKVIFFLLSWKKQADEEAAKEEKELKEEAYEALQSRDISRINVVVGKLRK